MRRLLVIDDEPAIRGLVGRVLGPRDFEVDEATDGYEGLRRAHETAYDIVLLDLQLPGLEGMAVLERLLAKKPGQAIIVSSCQHDPATVSDCLRAGARRFLPKPFSLGELWTCVSTCALIPSDRPNVAMGPAGRPSGSLSRSWMG
jgi:DNA-binding response OmpR family regulator